MPAPATDVYSDRDSAPDMPSETEAEDTEGSDNSRTDEKGDSKASESATALVGKTFFGDKKLEVGSKCEVRVKRILDDQIQLEYVKHKADDSDDDSEDEPEPDEDVYD